MRAEPRTEPDVKEIIKQMRELQEREGPTLGPGLAIRKLPRSKQAILSRPAKGYHSVTFAKTSAANGT